MYDDKIDIMKKLLISLMILTGCGPNYVEPTYPYCEIRELKNYILEFELDCNMVQEEVSLAMEVLDSWNLVPRSKQNTFKSISIVVHKDWCAGYWPECHTGEYSWFTYPHIELGHRRLSLFHELLHHWDSVNFVFNTYSHKNWETNGYNDAEQLEFVPKIKEIWERYKYNSTILPY